MLVLCGSSTANQTLVDLHPKLEINNKYGYANKYQTFICSNTKYKQVKMDSKKVTCPQVAWMPPMPLFKFQENVWHLRTKTNIEIAKRENKQGDPSDWAYILNI